MDEDGADDEDEEEEADRRLLMEVACIRFVSVPFSSSIITPTINWVKGCCPLKVNRSLIVSAREIGRVLSILEKEEVTLPLNSSIFEANPAFSFLSASTSLTSTWIAGRPVALRPGETVLCPNSRKTLWCNEFRIPDVQRRVEKNGWREESV